MKHLTPIGVQRLVLLNHCSTLESRKLCHSYTVVSSVLWAIKDTTSHSVLKKKPTQKNPFNLGWGTWLICWLPELLRSWPGMPAAAKGLSLLPQSCVEKPRAIFSLRAALFGAIILPRFPLYLSLAKHQPIYSSPELLLLFGINSMTTSFDRRNMAWAAWLRSDTGLFCSVWFQGRWNQSGLLEEAGSNPACPGRGRNLGFQRLSQPQAKCVTLVGFGLAQLPTVADAQLGAVPKPNCFTFSLQVFS